MKSVWKSLVQSTVAVCVSASLSTFASAQDSEQAGVVRISKPSSRPAANATVVPASAMMMDGSCAPGGAGMSAGAATPNSAGMGAGADGSLCPIPDGAGAGYPSYSCPPGLHGRFGHGYHGQQCYNPNGHAMLEYLKCKFGYFIPSGGGGQGVPWVGHYGRVYPVNPYYRDSRDGQMFAAQGYGVPMAVPLAPVVGHTYDYSWGVPSSRLTPVSNPAY